MMDDKDALIIGPSSDLDTAHFSDPDIAGVKRDFNRFYEQQRQAIISALRQMPSIIDAVDQITSGKTYEAIIPPEVRDQLKSGTAIWDRRKSGLQGPIIRDRTTGRIICQVDLKEISPEFWSSLSQLIVQRTLADIVQRLEVIDQKVTDTLVGQRNDRLATVESGINLYHQAMAAANVQIRHQILIEAVHKLNEGREQLILSLESDIRTLDEQLPRDSWALKLRAVFRDVPKQIQSHARPAQESFQAILRASYVLACAYQALDEPASLEVSLEPLKETLREVGTKGQEIARWLPYDPALPPEQLWGNNLLQLAEEVESIDKELQMIHLRTVGIAVEASEVIDGGMHDHSSV
jgi:hypothetical protein